jgi:rhamnosyltransferase
MVALSVLLLTKNGSRDLERLLPALYAQNVVGSFEVIAIDSGSTDGTTSLLKHYPLRLEQIPAETFHHARTRNFAADLARGEILIFLSQDAMPASRFWLSKMISNFDDPKVGAVYGRQIPKPGSLAERQDTLDTVYGAHKFVKDPQHRNGLGYRFYHFSDANAAIRRSVWQATRFPEDLKVFEDLGIAKRILDSGWKIVYEPEASVYHSHNHTTLGLFKRYFDIGYTLRRLKIWDAPGTRKSLSRDAWKMLKKKFSGARTLSTKRRPGEGIQQDIAKSFGLLLGLNQACLPLILKRHLSAFRVFG